MSGTAVAYNTTRVLRDVRYCHTLYAAMRVLRDVWYCHSRSTAHAVVCYAMSGTGIGYAATRLYAMCGSDGTEYAATRRPVLTPEGGSGTDLSGTNLGYCGSRGADVVLTGAGGCGSCTNLGYCGLPGAVLMWDIAVPEGRIWQPWKLQKEKCLLGPLRPGVGKLIA
eukprot:3533956-Rhodomonas_salina.2